jgi:hypothetical protein
MLLAALTDPTHLRHPTRTIYWYTYYNRTSCPPIRPRTRLVSSSIPFKSIGDDLLPCYRRWIATQSLHSGSRHSEYRQKWEIRFCWWKAQLVAGTGLIALYI